MLDETSLTHSAGWARPANAGYNGATVLSTKTLGATVTRTGPHTDRVGLVATTSAACGTAGVLFHTSRADVVDHPAQGAAHPAGVLAENCNAPQSP